MNLNNKSKNPSIIFKFNLFNYMIYFDLKSYEFKRKSNIQCSLKTVYLIEP